MRDVGLGCGELWVPPPSGMLLLLAPQLGAGPRVPHVSQLLEVGVAAQVGLGAAVTALPLGDFGEWLSVP